MSIGKAIRKYRKEKTALTQWEFAKMLGSDQSYISTVERGHKTPSVDMVDKMVEVLGVPLCIIMWHSLEEDQVKHKEAFNIVKPAIDNLIDQFIK